jgi:hypothetical protein
LNQFVSESAGFAVEDVSPEVRGSVIVDDRDGERSAANADSGFSAVVRASVHGDGFLILTHGRNPS